MKFDIKIIIVLLFCTAIAIGFYIFYQINSCQKIKCIQIMEKNKYKIKDVYEENKYVFRGLLSNGNDLLKVEVKSDFRKDDADQAVQAQLARTKGVFEDAAAPYPGEISDVIACSNEYKPVYSAKDQNGIHISYFEGYVNERLVFGSCVDDQAAYHDTLAMFYCEKQRKFYQLEIILPRKEYISNPKKNNEILDSIGCAN